MCGFLRLFTRIITTLLLFLRAHTYRFANNTRIRLSSKEFQMITELEYRQNRYTVLKLANPNNPIIIRDIYNKRQKIRRSELRNKTPISTLLKALIEKQSYGDEFFTLYQSKGGIKGGPLNHLFIAPDKHIDLLIKNSEILITD